jgi:hypothetical protein
MESLNINLAVEGVLDEVVARKLLEESERGYRVAACYGKRGKDYLRANIAKFSQAAAITPYLILADLDDQIECAPILVRDWIPSPHPKLVLRIAVHEVESWLIADRDAFSKFLGVPANKIPIQSDKQPRPKELIVALARNSRKREIREDLVPTLGSTSKVGKNYNGKLIEFVLRNWQIEDALRNSPSLAKCVNALVHFNE